MTAKERLIKYIETKKISQYKFSQKTGLSIGFLTKGNTLSVDNLNLISSVFDDLNPLWVLSGEGEMLLHHIGHTQIGSSNKIDHSPINVNTVPELDQLKKENELLKERLKDKEEIIKLLKSKK